MSAAYILTLRDDADPSRVLGALAAAGLWARPLDGGSPRLIEVEAGGSATSASVLAAIPGIANVALRASAHPLVDARAGQPVLLASSAIGPGCRPLLMAGPCAVESEAQIARIAEAVAEAGGALLRGSAWKPRSSPYAFQGHGAPALRWLRTAADRVGLAVVTEALAPDQAGAVAEVADLVQIGSRNMQNFVLLRAVGREQRPVLLKRGNAATIEEWLLAAEYCLDAGAPGVVFCERGLRGFDPSTRNLLDLGAVALLSHALRLPVVVDPSHAAGRRDLVPALSHAALAAGAHGLLVETHDDPGHALSDGPQALAPTSLAGLLGGNGKGA
jgi:3-deoxy-7-phosphoheptulonate synthase